VSSPEPPDPKLQRSLDALAAVAGTTAIRARDLSRTHRQRLQANGLIEEVVKGWYVPVDADRGAGTAARWQDTYWSFCADYLTARFDRAWCLAPEHALAIHGGDWTIPDTLTVRAARGGNKPLTLPFGTRLLDLRLPPPGDGVEPRGPGLRIQSLASALVSTPAAAFAAHPRTLVTALWMLDDVDALAAALIDGTHSTVAGRLIGALRHVARDDLAAALTERLTAADVAPTVSDPFAGPTPSALLRRNPSPYPNRTSLRRAWRDGRARVLDAWAAAPQPDASGLAPADAGRMVELAAPGDHAGAWRDGLCDACAAAEDELGHAAPGEAGAVAAARLGDWHRRLLAPLTRDAGQTSQRPAGTLRRRSRYRRGALHTPPRHDAMRDLLPVLFEQLDAEPDRRVAAVLGHALLTYLAPFDTGNELLAWATSRALLRAAGCAGVPSAGATAGDYRQALENAWFGAPERLTRLLAGAAPADAAALPPVQPADSW